MDEDTLPKIVAELTAMPIGWYLEDTDRVEAMLAWIGDLLKEHPYDPDLSNWLNVLVAAEYEQCESCDHWFHYSEIVLVPITGYPDENVDCRWCKGCAGS